jgi:hypothetical protein
MKKILILLTFFALIFNLTSCLVEEEEESSDSYKMTFKVNGVSKTFYGSKFGLDPYDDTYNNFYNNPDNGDEDVYVKFPESIAAGTYDQDEVDLIWDYSESSTVSYSSQYSSSVLTITVTEWGVTDGAPIRGTFSGTIYTFDGSDSVSITEGSFESALTVN